MRNIENSLSEINGSMNYISIFLFIIVLQGCFGCNRCKHEKELPEREKKEINWSEEWQKFKYK